jgi:hypothetical protein
VGHLIHATSKWRQVRAPIGFCEVEVEKSPAPTTVVDCNPPVGRAEYEQIQMEREGGDGALEDGHGVQADQAEAAVWRYLQWNGWVGRLKITNEGSRKTVRNSYPELARVRQGDDDVSVEGSVVTDAMAKVRSD